MTKRPLIGLVKLLLLTTLGMLAGCDEPARTVSVEQEESVSEAKASQGQAGIWFALNGEEKFFQHMPPEKNMAMSSATLLLARPAPDSIEAFSIMVMNFNLKKAELPVTLTLSLKDAISEETPAISFARSAKPMIQYTSAGDNEYRGYAAITWQSFNNGWAVGHIDDIQLEPVKASDNPAPLSLSSIRFRAKMR